MVAIGSAILISIEYFSVFRFLLSTSKLFSCVLLLKLSTSSLHIHGKAPYFTPGSGSKGSSELRTTWLIVLSMLRLQPLANLALRPTGMRFFQKAVRNFFDEQFFQTIQRSDAFVYPGMQYLKTGTSESKPCVRLF